MFIKTSSPRALLELGGEGTEFSRTRSPSSGRSNTPAHSVKDLQFVQLCLRLAVDQRRVRAHRSTFPSLVYTYPPKAFVSSRVRPESDRARQARLQVEQTNLVSGAVSHDIVPVCLFFDTRTIPPKRTKPPRYYSGSNCNKMNLRTISIASSMEPNRSPVCFGLHRGMNHTPQTS